MKWPRLMFLCRWGWHVWAYHSSCLDRGCRRCGRQEVFSSAVGNWISAWPQQFHNSETRPGTRSETMSQRRSETEGAE